MKTFAALIAGLLLSTMTFVAGLAIALALLNVDEPEHHLDSSNTAALWSTEPVLVDKTAQSFERIATRPVAQERKVAALSRSDIGTDAIKAAITTDASSNDDRSIDPVTTGAIDPADATAGDMQAAAHMEWCASRYRSYSAETNTYRPYGGGQRTCQSPYSQQSNTADASRVVNAESRAATEENPAMEQVAYQDAEETYAGGHHIQSCLDRYRSYRPADNSYQPFDGGPRQQCQ